MATTCWKAFGRTRTCSTSRWWRRAATAARRQDPGLGKSRRDHQAVANGGGVKRRGTGSGSLLQGRGGQAEGLHAQPVGDEEIAKGQAQVSFGSVRDLVLDAAR